MKNAQKFVDKSMDSKRKANLPCQSDNKFKKTTSSDCSFESANSTIEEEGFNMPKISIVTLRVAKRDGEDFKGSLDHVQGCQVWNDGLKLPEAWLFGVSIVKSANRPFLLEFQLNCEVEVDIIPKYCKVKIDNHDYTIELIPPQDFKANIGDEVTVRIKRTRWLLKPDQVTNWMKLYGEIIKPVEYEEAPGVQRLKTDELKCVIKLAKHIPNLLPAYGRRMNVVYSGQPIQCGRCFELNHLRANCTNEQADWIKDYVRRFYEEGHISSVLLGRWFEIFKSTLE